MIQFGESRFSQFQDCEDTFQENFSGNLPGRHSTCEEPHSSILNFALL